MKRILLALLSLGVVAAGVFAWWMLSQNGKSLDVVLIAPERIQAGIPVEVSVTMNNESSSELKDAQVSLSLPEGFIFVGVPGRRSVENRPVGTLAANNLTKESFMIMAVGSENIVAKLNASVSYIPGALSSRFEKVVSRDVVVGESGIEFTIAPPTKVFGGEEFESEITIRNNSSVSFENLSVKLAYPQGFSFHSSTQAAVDSANTTWNVGALSTGGETTFSLKGAVMGQDNENFEIRGSVTAALGEGEYELVKQVATVALQPSPLSIQVTVAPEVNAVFGTGESLQYRLSYANNTAVGLRDVIVRAKLVGEMFDLKSLKTTDGVLRSSDNTIIWNAARVPAFANLAPNANGFLEFSINTKQSFPITRLSSKNYMVTVQAEIESPTVPPNVSAKKTLGLSSLSNKLRGALNLSVLGYYRDATAGIVNGGIFPPRVGQPTQFTVHWALRNTSTDVENIHLRAFLGPNVRYTGVFKTNLASSTPAYNDRTQELTWDIPRVQATRGILSDPLELTFQVELTPAANQVQTNPVLVQETTMTYKDAFTLEQRTALGKEITTRLPDDLTIVGGDRAVKE